MFNLIYIILSMQQPIAVDIQLSKIFEAVRSLLLPYSKVLEVRVDTNTRYELWSNKQVEIAGRKKKAVFFASVIIQKDYVGFYFMPVYTDTDIMNIFPQDLLKLLKGKSCFHIKDQNKVILKQIETALKMGFKLYKQRGWL